MNRQHALVPEVPRMPCVSLQWPRLDLKSEHQSNLPSAGSAAYMCALRVLVSASYTQPCSPRQGLRPCHLSTAKSSLPASMPRPQALANSRPRPSPPVVVLCGFRLCMNQCLWGLRMS